MIGSVIKYFRFTYDYVLWDISYANLQMLLASIPEYESIEEEKVEHVESLDGLADFLK